MHDGIGILAGLIEALGTGGVWALLVISGVLAMLAGAGIHAIARPYLEAGIEVKRATARRETADAQIADEYRRQVMADGIRRGNT